jgi:hypothetical protein
MGRIKTLMLAVVVGMLAATVPCGVTLAQTERNQKAGEIPHDVLAALQNDLKDDLEEINSAESATNPWRSA